MITGGGSYSCLTGLEGKSNSSASLSHRARDYDQEYALLRGEYEESLADLKRLADSTTEEIFLPRVDDGCSFRSRQTYARFAVSELDVLHRKWDELQELISRYPERDQRDQRDQRDPHPSLKRMNTHTGLTGLADDRHRNGHSPQLPHRERSTARSLTLSMSMLSDGQSEDDEASKIDEW
eukprot:CAMPEP_0119304942 /NCGR_PEP_ID=MMETSP1333-20130426/6054_1 /TAXON_ID=418940 /ORGANISM="Scyphosphaera apsteinii, Strain RCC1455" /LENGTH=179 /DNA_ID=CAMNT_0007307921 /DNA_START=384 /DNA_END=923 /DNA_ORIENTATION=+